MGMNEDMLLLFRETKRLYSMIGGVDECLWICHRLLSIANKYQDEGRLELAASFYKCAQHLSKRCKQKTAEIDQARKEFREQFSPAIPLDKLN